MKKKNSKQPVNRKSESPVTSKTRGNEQITRSEAIRKIGYTTLSAATMMLLLNNPAKAQMDHSNYPGQVPGGDQFW